MGTLQHRAGFCVRSLVFTVLTGVALVMSAGGALAHHAFAMFEDRPTPLEGTVQEFRFTNPHAFIILRVKGQDGHTVTWTLEGPSPTSLVRDGWSIKCLKPGDQLKMTIWPLREGKNGGVFYPRYMTFRDGRAIGGS
jgi:hypothetical protein